MVRRAAREYGTNAVAWFNEYATSRVSGMSSRTLSANFKALEMDAYGAAAVDSLATSILMTSPDARVVGDLRSGCISLSGGVMARIQVPEWKHALLEVRADYRRSKQAGAILDCTITLPAPLGAPITAWQFLIPKVLNRTGFRQILAQELIERTGMVTESLYLRSKDRLIQLVGGTIADAAYGVLESSGEDYPDIREAVGTAEILILTDSISLHLMNRRVLGRFETLARSPDAPSDYSHQHLVLLMGSDLLSTRSTITATKALPSNTPSYFAPSASEAVKTSRDKLISHRVRFGRHAMASTPILGLGRTAIEWDDHEVRAALICPESTARLLCHYRNRLSQRISQVLRHESHSLHRLVLKAAS